MGPPRVWERNTNTPGLCITRSLGDTGAKRLGVTHVPELLTFKLTKGDRYGWTGRKMQTETTVTMLGINLGLRAVGTHCPAQQGGRSHF